MMSQDAPHPILLGGDILSTFAVVGTIAGYLPFVSAFVGLIWFCIQIFDRFGWSAWLVMSRSGYKERRRLRKLASLAAQRARIAVVIEELEKEH